MRTRGGIRGVAAESVLVGAGGRAILLQLAHPAVARGVARHSDFVHAPLRRLTSTLDYIYLVVFGTADERASARQHVERAHAPVRGPAEDGAPSYAADDPTLQLWVAATLYDSAMAMHERVLPPLPDDEAERVYREYAVLGEALGMPPALWPATRADFGVWWADRLAELPIGDDARRVARDLLHPQGPGAPVWLRTVMPIARLLTTGLLDERQRAGFGLPWSPRRQAVFEVVMRVTRILWPLLPPGLRHAPAIRSLRRHRSRSRRG
ncbi:oxygenase MpaB family protein [Labedella endophytica]|uniref:oxygenase MpaB family protein n=1 Tax=Labedella endophytica TaxID=1523160 RepID=UPI001FB774D8|nr:oxygenase MpaB family protein [Labedella endophytica]